MASQIQFKPMMISLPGVLERAATQCKNSGSPHLEFPLLQLLQHIRELEQDRTMVDRFFEIWDCGKDA